MSLARSTWSEWTSLSLEEKNYRILTQAEECASFCANKGCAAFHVREQKECWCNTEAYYNSITDFADCGLGECIVADETSIGSKTQTLELNPNPKCPEHPLMMTDFDDGLCYRRWQGCFRRTV